MMLPLSQEATTMPALLPSMHRTARPVSKTAAADCCVRVKASERRTQAETTAPDEK
jgi:hypothetical protein